MAGPDGVMRAALPGAVLRSVTGAKRFVSYPFSDVCGPVGSGPEELAAITDAVSYGAGLSKRNWSQTELRSEHETDGSHTAYSGYVGHILRLTRPADDIFASFHKDCVQRRIRKSFRAGLAAYEGSELSDIRDFYRLHLKTRKKLGAPVQPFSFFRNLWETLYPEGLISVILVKTGEKPVSGAVLLKFGGRVTYKFGASDAEYTNLGSNQLAIWTAIRKASDEGFMEFDFGRSFAAHAGLIDYKSRWGAEEVQLSYLFSPPRKLSVKDEGGRCVKLASSVLKTLPSFSNRLLGRLFYKYLA